VEKMNIIKINFNNDFEEEFQKAVDEVFNLVSPIFRQHKYNWEPHIDVYESPDEIIILADLAGINKEELKIELTRKKIKISGVRKAIFTFKNARYCLAEIPHGYFIRNIILPVAVDAESAIASYADGILTVRINKQPDHKTHRIRITTSE
jgi:HSP20 family protein